MMTHRVLSCVLMTASTLLLSHGLHAGEHNQTNTFYGINEDPVWNFRADEPTTNELAQFAGMLTQTRCGALRMPLRWRVMEPSKDRWDFSVVDRAVNIIPEDIEILGTLLSVPQWANGVDPAKAEGWFDIYPPQNLNDWTTYVSKTVEHYRHRIKHWEIWNEENGVDFYRPHPDANAYMKLLRATYLAAKQVDPECVIVLGGLQMNGIIPNPWSEVKVPNYLEALYKAGARPYFDVCNIHPYVLPHEGSGYMMQLTRDTLSLMARYGERCYFQGCRGGPSASLGGYVRGGKQGTTSTTGVLVSSPGYAAGHTRTGRVDGLVQLSRESQASIARFCRSHPNRPRLHAAVLQIGW